MKVLIAVESCQKNRHDHQVIRETWGADIPEHLDVASTDPSDLPEWVRDIRQRQRDTRVDLRFFVGGPEITDAARDEVWLEVPDGWAELSIKTHAIVQWAVSAEYDYLFKCDTDTYAVPSRLINSNFWEHDYIGQTLLGHPTSGGFNYAHGGAGYWLSRKAMSVVSDETKHQFTTMPDGSIIHEDTGTGRALGRRGIVIFHDDRYRGDVGWSGQPERTNNYITTHKCTERQLREIHSQMKDNGSLALSPLKPGVTWVITSCHRPDLLKITLKSFMRLNTHPIARTIIIEDGPDMRLEDIGYEGASLPNLWQMANAVRRGQVFSIDRAYSEVNTEYIFHCEDDWEFTRSGFIEQSLSILEKYPNVFQVWIDSEPVPLGVNHPCGLPAVSSTWGWPTLNWHPSLRRTAEYRSLGSYRKVLPAGMDGIEAERHLSKLYQVAGFQTVRAPGTYTRHTGYGRHVGNPTPTPIQNPTMPKLTPIVWEPKGQQCGKGLAQDGAVWTPVNQKGRHQ